MEFHRGQALPCIRGWAQEQKFPRELFEIIIASPLNHPAAELDEIRSILSPNDRLLQFDYHHDMDLIAQAAQATRGEILFFTESHCLPEPETLERADAAARAHPEWAGFSCHSVPVTHNLLSQIEAEFYEREIQFGMNEHPWRKVLDQCFVVRRLPYLQVSGFDPAFGHFAEWLIAARFHARGFTIGYAPEVRVRHFYIGQYREWREFTEDFIEGQMKYHAQQPRDPLEPMFEEVPEWSGRHNFRRDVARRMRRVLFHDLREITNTADVSGPGEWFSRLRRWHWRLYAKWFLRAVAGCWVEMIRAWFRKCSARMALRWHLLRRDKTRAKTSITRCCETISSLARAHFVHQWIKTLKRNGGHKVPRESHGLWMPGLLTEKHAAGFHLASGTGHETIRWSEPAAAVELPIQPGRYTIRVAFLFRPPVNDDPRLTFFINETPVLAQDTSVSHDHVDLRVRIGKSRFPARLAWVCTAHQAPGDVRALGLPVTGISWSLKKSVHPLDAPSATKASQSRPLFFLHIRKNAGVSLRALLSNRFASSRCLFQAHSIEQYEPDSDRFDFVTGHVAFNFVKSFSARPFVFTVLREPLDRAISTYYFFRENKETLFRQLERELPAEEFASRRRFTELARCLSLPEFLEKEPDLSRRHLSNIQTRSFVSASPGNELRRDHLEEAKSNLASCDIVGLTERLPETLALLEAQLGWHDLGPMPHLNATRSRESLSNINPASRQLLASWNELDIDLYKFAKHLFAQQIDTRAAGPTTADPAGNQTLPDAARFTFDQPIHGRGWHEREKYADAWICWMGVSLNASLHLCLSQSSASRLSCGIVCGADTAILQSLQLSVNHQPVPSTLLFDGTRTWIEADVPGGILQRLENRVVVGFHISHTLRPSDRDSENPDRRTLGVAFDSVSLTPGTMHGSR